jgi:hypothetical protein
LKALFYGLSNRLARRLRVDVLLTTVAADVAANRID